MAFFNIFARVNRRVDLMDDMMVTLQVRQALSELPNSGHVLRRAAIRCLNCGESESCKAWLDGHWQEDEAPSYCRNRDLFARIKRQGAPAPAREHA